MFDVLIYYYVLSLMSISFMHKKEKSVFFNYMDFQIVKINGFYKIILAKADFIVPFEFGYGGIQPDWLLQIKLLAYII